MFQLRLPFLSPFFHFCSEIFEMAKEEISENLLKFLKGLKDKKETEKLKALKKFLFDKEMRKKGQCQIELWCSQS